MKADVAGRLPATTDTRNNHGRILSARRRGAPPNARRRAGEALLAVLRKVPALRAADARELARRVGVSFDTLKRAKRDLGIGSKRIAGRWIWQGGQKPRGRIAGILPPLREPAHRADFRALPGGLTPSVSSKSLTKNSENARRGNPNRSPGYWAEVVGPLLRRLKCNPATYWRLFNAKCGEGLVVGAIREAIAARKGIGWVIGYIRRCAPDAIGGTA